MAERKSARDHKPKRPLPNAEKQDVSSRAAGAATADRINARKCLAWKQWSRSENSIVELCEHICAGGHLAGFARNRNFSYTSMARWIERDTDRNAMYAHAREERSLYLIDEMVSIADEAHVHDVLDRKTGERIAVVFDQTAHARNRLRIETRQWYANRLLCPRSKKVDQQAKDSLAHISDEQMLVELAKWGITIARIG